MNRRIGAVDVGTNSVLLTIAEDRHGHLVPVAERATITRLGQGVDRQRRLDPSAVARTLAALSSYRDLLDAHGTSETRVACTSAVRDAQDGAHFLEQARRILGVPLDVITGTEEASLTFAGALSSLALEGPVTVFDVGGGSTEIIHGSRTLQGGAVVHDMVSLDIGSVRLTERHVRSDPPTAAELEAIAATVDGQLARVTPPARGVTLVGVAGTVTTLAAVSAAMRVYDPDVIHGSVLSRADLDALFAKLSAASTEDRLQLPGLEPGRADVIVAGAAIVERLMSWAAASELVVSDRGVRWGLLARLVSA